MKNEIYRQGDVLLRRVSFIPETAKPAEKKDAHGNARIVLAYGEVTGHAHVITLPDTERHKVRYWNAGAERFLQVMEKVALTHEEHGEIVLDKGIYRQGFQVEDFGEEVRRVAD